MTKQILDDTILGETVKTDINNLIMAKKKKKKKI